MVTGIDNAGNDGVQKTDLMKFADFKKTVSDNVKSETAQKILQYFSEQNLKDDDYVDLNTINQNQDEEITTEEWGALGIYISDSEATKLDKALQTQRNSAHEKDIEEMNKMKAIAAQAPKDTDVIHPKACFGGGISKEELLDMFKKGRDVPYNHGKATIEDIKDITEEGKEILKKLDEYFGKGECKYL